MFMKVKVMVSLCCAVLFAVIVLSVLPVNGEEKIYSDLVRLHVIANSDSDEDQALKLKVRDAVLSEACALDMGTDKESAQAALSANRERLCAAARRTVEAEGYTYGVSVELGSEKYPERKLYAVDSLCASLGEGLFVDLCHEKKEAGMTIDELRDYAESLKLHICHWFTVNDLMFLKRGGRVSAATAIVGSVLSIKPVMHMDNEGHLIKVDVARGRKASLRALVAKMEKLATDPEKQRVYICHGDCLQDAEYVASLVREKFGITDIRINYVGPVIGAHTGPGVVSLFFVGSER